MKPHKHFMDNSLFPVCGQENITFKDKTEEIFIPLFQLHSRLFRSKLINA